MEPASVCFLEVEVMSVALLFAGVPLPPVCCMVSLLLSNWYGIVSLSVGSPSLLSVDSESVLPFVKDCGFRYWCLIVHISLVAVIWQPFICLMVYRIGSYAYVILFGIGCLIGLCCLSVDWHSSHMLWCLPSVSLQLPGVGHFLGLPCVETGLRWLFSSAVEFCIICCWPEAALVGIPWCNAAWLCRIEESVEWLSSRCDNQCVIVSALFLGFSWNFPPYRLSMAQMVLL